MCPKLAAHLGLQILTRQLAWAQSPRHPLPRVSVSLWFDCFQTLFPGVCVGKWERNLLPACPYPPEPVPSPPSPGSVLHCPSAQRCVFSPVYMSKLGSREGKWPVGVTQPITPVLATFTCFSHQSWHL